MPARLRNPLRHGCIALLGVVALLLAGCRSRPRPEAAPRAPAARVIEENAATIMAIPGVVGLYEGRTRAGGAVIRVMLASDADTLRRRIPTRLGGYAVEIEVTGVLRPMDR